MLTTYRILDANANRAREALRVMEEAARFILDDPALTRLAKTLRHDLAQAMGRLDRLVPNRDTPGDVGTGVSTPSESHRAGEGDVVTAAGKRLSEALRAIEEYAKTLPETERELAAVAEQLRYRGYDLEQRLDRALASRRAPQWRLCVLISQDLCPGCDWFAIARAVVEGGGDCIQLREKALEAGELLERARRLVDYCQPRGVSVIVNDRPDVALVAGAAGVHLGQTDLPCREVRRLVGGQFVVGVSTSSLDEARQALTDGASYCGVGPMFPTTTKHKDVIVGPAYLRQYLQWDRLPHLAIGGIHRENVDQLVQVGVRGVAVSSAVCAAPDPAQAVRDLVARLEGEQKRIATDERRWTQI